MSEYVVKLTDGTVVECNTVEAVRRLTGEFAGKIAKAGPGSAGSGGATVPKKQKKRPRNFRSPGIGPKKLWSMAMLHSVATGQTKNDARSELSKLKKTDKRAYLDKDEAHSAFLAWYMKKAKIDQPIAAMDALAAMFDERHDEYTALVGGYKPTKPAARRRRTGR